MPEHWEDRLHRERDEARELADFRGEQVVRLSEECAHLRHRVAELEAYAPRMDGPSRVEYLERRVAELEDEVRELEASRTECVDGMEELIADRTALQAKLAERDAWISKVQGSSKIMGQYLPSTPWDGPPNYDEMRGDVQYRGMPLPPAPADDVSEMRAICAEEGCAAPSEEMRALDTLTVRTREEEPVIEECRALDEEYVCPHCGQRDELFFSWGSSEEEWRWRCICDASEDERGYRPAGEVSRG